MSSRSLNEILIKIPTELFDFILLYRELFVYICTRRDDAHRIQQRCFIYRSIFAILALRKRRVLGHSAAYHFRISNKIFIIFSFYNFKLQSFLIYPFKPTPSLTSSGNTEGDRLYMTMDLLE